MGQSARRGAANGEDGCSHARFVGEEGDDDVQHIVGNAADKVDTVAEVYCGSRSTQLCFLVASSSITAGRNTGNLAVFSLAGLSRLVGTVYFFNN